jgi:hypothetical protein
VKAGNSSDNPAPAWGIGRDICLKTTPAPVHRKRAAMKLIVK